MMIRRVLVLRRQAQDGRVISRATDDLNAKRQATPVETAGLP